MSSGLLSYGVELFHMMRNELIIFVIAVTVHALLFSKHRVPGAKKGKIDASQEKSPKNILEPRVPKQAGSSPWHEHVPKTENDAYAIARQKEREAQASCINSLKSLQRGVSHAEIERTLALAMNHNELDEAMLTAIVDACIRVSRADLLEQWIRKHRSNFTRIKRAHTFSSVIRAFGAIRDVDGVWATWSEMRKCHVMPTCVTLGCMVEALVSNTDPDSAYDLIHEIQTEEKDGGKSVVNAVIYGTVLKGFAHQKKFSRVWSVYQEMLAIETDFTIVTFNTIIDACARCEELHRIPTLLKDMDRLQIQPNIITYGAILKGYCQDGNLDKAYELLQSMRETTQFRPDEIMYNSLLDGCARQGLWERANAVLQEMEEAGIRPSNFTLSVLVKVGRRSTCRVDNVFLICSEVAKRYGFKFNVHVYTNLVHTCVDRKDWTRAVSTFESMVKDRVRPETRTYAVLLKGLIGAGEMHLANGFLRAAMGLAGAQPQLLQAADKNTSRLRPENSLPKALIAEIVDAIVGACVSYDEELCARLLNDVKHLGLSIDPRVKLRFATRAAKN